MYQNFLYTVIETNIILYVILIVFDLYEITKHNDKERYENLQIPDKTLPLVTGDNRRWFHDFGFKCKLQNSNSSLVAMHISRTN